MTLQATPITVTGPRGAQGNTLRVVTAAPTSSIGVDGDAAHDTTNGQLYYSRVNGSWDLTKKVATTGLVGATGPTTYSAPPELFSQYSFVVGAPSGLTSPYASATGPFQLTHVGTPDVVHEFTPAYPSAFLGASFTNYSTTVAQTYALVNVTSGSTVYTSNVIAGSSDATPSVAGPFAATAYPMAANNTYVWTVTNAQATANNYTVITPCYSMPSQAGIQSSHCGLAVYGNAGETYTTTNATMYNPGPVTGLRQSFKNIKPFYTNFAMMQNGTSAALVFSWGNFSQTVAANSVAISTVNSPGLQVVAAGNTLSWTVRTSSGTATGPSAATIVVATTP